MPWTRAGMPSKYCPQDSRISVVGQPATQVAVFFIGRVMSPRRSGEGALAKCRGGDGDGVPGAWLFF